VKTKKVVTYVVIGIIMILLLMFVKPSVAREAAKAGLRWSRIVKESVQKFAMPSSVTSKAKGKRKPEDFLIGGVGGFVYRRSSAGGIAETASVEPVQIGDRMIQFGPDYGMEQGMESLPEQAAQAPQKKQFNEPVVIPLAMPQQPTGSGAANSPPVVLPSPPPYVYPPTNPNSSTGVIQPTGSTPQTPIPASILFLGSGLAGIAGIRLKKSIKASQVSKILE